MSQFKCPHCQQELHQIGFDMKTPHGTVQHFICNCSFVLWVKSDSEPLTRIETTSHLDESDPNNIVVDTYKKEEF